MVLILPVMIGIHLISLRIDDDNDIENISHSELMKLDISILLTMSMNVEQIQIRRVSPSSTITKLSCSFHDHGKIIISLLVQKRLLIPTISVIQMLLLMVVV